MSADEVDIKANSLDERAISVESDNDALSELDALLVETYVTDARIGRPSSFKPERKELQYYRLYNSWYMQWLLYLTVSLFFLLVLFEKPAYAKAPLWATMLIELVCITAFVARVFHGSLFAPDRWKYLRDRKNVTIIVLVVLTILDMFVYIVLCNTCCSDSAVRATRVLRPLFLINLSNFRQVRKAFRNIRKTLPDIITVLILLLIAIILFALLGYLLFKDKNFKDYKNREYFDSYRDAVFNLYVLVTSANSPDVMMPAYNESGWYAFFFIIFTIICMYIFMSIFLAVVYHNYRKQLKKEVMTSVRRRCESLRRAFHILRKKVNGCWIVTVERFHEMMRYMSPKRSSAQVQLLWEVLDENGNGKVRQKEFYHIANLFSVQVVEVKDTITIFEKYFPNVYKSKISKWIINAVKHKAFGFVFDFVIVVNAIFIGLDFEDEDEDKGEAVFLVLFNIEIALKFYAYGFFGFFRRLWNIFDMVVIWAATIAELVEVGKQATDENWYPSQIALDVLMVLRVLRLLKIMRSIKRFQAVLRTILQIGPAVTTYGALLLVLYYVYAIIGMEIFGSKVDFYALGQNATVNDTERARLCGGHQELDDMEFSDLKYCKNNFNNVVRSFVTLFDLMVVNQWHVITQGFVLMTHWTARIYFISFHLICVVLVLNIFVAFILEAFMLQYDTSVSTFENAVDKKINELGVGVGLDPDPSMFTRPLLDSQELEHVSLDVEDAEGGSSKNHNINMSEQGSHSETIQQLAIQAQTRFRVSSKIQNAELLLQRMFEDELKREDSSGWQTIYGEDLSDAEDEDADDERGGAGSYYTVTALSATVV